MRSPWTILAAGLLLSAARADRPRHLVYPPPATGAPTKVQLIFGLGIPMEVDVSTIVGYVFKCNYNLPYNASYLHEPVARQRRSAGPGIGLGRYEVYRMLEAGLESGKACLLRAVCEAAATPFSLEHGVFGRLLHIFLTPSSTREAPEAAADREYLAAESIGRSGRRDCSRTFPECPGNFLEYLSKVQ